MKLIDLLVQELPKKGGWPQDARTCAYGVAGGRNALHFGTGRLGMEEYHKPSIFEVYGADSVCLWCGVEIRIDKIPEDSPIITKGEYEEALARLKQKTSGDEPLPPIGTIVQGLPLDAASFEKPFMFVISCIHDGCFIGEAMAGGKVYGELSLWQISPVPSKEEMRREEALFDINKLIGDIEKYPTWRHAVCGIYDAIAAGDIRGLRAE